jgi:hypothetical protein
MIDLQLRCVVFDIFTVCSSVKNGICEMPNPIQVVAVDHIHSLLMSIRVVLQHQLRSLPVLQPFEASSVLN